MAWYAYCIGEKQAFPALARHRKPVALESVFGVSRNQVFLYPASDLAVIVSEHNPQETLNQRSGVDHARVISDCFQHSTVLPFRFGTVFNDDESRRRVTEFLRRTRPDAPRPFRVPWAPFTCVLGAVFCVTIAGFLSHGTWIRLVLWTILGFAIYAVYGFKHSRLRKR